MKRLDKDDYYLNIAFEVSKRSTCLRRHFGAVIIKDDSIISTGYNGSARGTPNCLDIGNCLKDKYSREEGKNYDKCRVGPLHAEVNAIINAARKNGNVLGGIMYLAGEYSNGKICDAYPCLMCKKNIINSGLEKVIIRNADGKIKKFNVKDWIKESWKNKEKDVESFY